MLVSCIELLKNYYIDAWDKRREENIVSMFAWRGESKEFVPVSLEAGSCLGLGQNVAAVFRSTKVFQANHM